MAATVNPQLAQQLREAPEGEVVEAVFTLRPSAKGGDLTPAATRAAVERAINRAKKATGTSPGRITVFDNIQSFAVSGPAALIKALTGFSEIASAIGNRQAQDLLIRPVKRREVKLPK